jgi:hypothetical protein
MCHFGPPFRLRDFSGDLVPSGKSIAGTQCRTTGSLPSGDVQGMALFDQFKVVVWLEPIDDAPTPSKC